VLKDYSNPYDPTRPVQDRDRLFGRDDDLLWIEQQLILGRRFIIVYGPNLIGKTSLVSCLPANLPERVRPIHFDCRLYQDAPIGEVWTALACEVGRQLGSHGSAPPTANPEDPLRLIGDELRQATLADDGQLLLVLDDVHLLWDDGDDAASTRVLEVFTGLLGVVPALRMLVTMSKGAYAGLTHPLRHGAEILHLGPLSNEDAQQLVTRPAQGIIRFDPGAVRRLADIASNQPYYLQFFCQALFSRCARDGNLNQSDVDVVLADLLQQPNPRFQALWDESDMLQRAALVAMSRVKGTHGLTTRQEVITYLMRYNGVMTPQPIVAALEQLAARGILVRMGAISYRFAFKFFSYWLERHIDPEVVLERIDWERLTASVPEVPPETSDASDVPIEPEQPRRAHAANWVIAGLGGTAVAGLALWGLIFAGVWSVGLFDPTPTPTVARALVDFISPIATPTATPVPPTPTPTNPVIVTRTIPSIVFRARNTGGGGDLAAWQLFVMNVDGTNRQRITFANNEDITPIWSPDGSRIAYVSKIGENREILVIPAPGAPRAGGIEASFEPPDRYEAQAINITRNPANDWTIGWSPDSRYIAFSSNRAGAWQIFIARADGSGQQQITNDGAGRLGPVWSPDYKLMAYAGKDGDNWDIYVMPAPGPDGTGAQPERARRLTFAEGNDLAPIFSPDGKRIVFESNRDGNSEIYVMNVDGSNQRNISNSPSTNDQGPIWSPDGKQILFYSGRAGNWDLFLVSADGQNLVNLTNTPDIDEQEPSWRP
jgi:TolB protein